MAYTEVSGNRGLQSTATTGTQKARASINNTSDKIRDGLASTKTFTIVVVVSMTAISASGGRIFGINDRAGSTGQLMFYGDSLSTLRMTFNAVDWAQAITVTSGTRHVFHFVCDTNLAANRLVVYKDGSSFGYSTGTDPGQNATISLPADLDLIAFNRESSGSFDRSVTGIIYGASLHNAAFTSGEVATDYAAWAADDDTPAGGSSPAKVASHNYKMRRVK
jgi:hypothetical protein